MLFSKVWFPADVTNQVNYVLLGTYILLLVITEFISFQQRAQYQDQLARKRYDDQLVQQVS